MLEGLIYNSILENSRLFEARPKDEKIKSRLSELVLDHLKKNTTELTGRRIKLFMISDMKGFSYLKIKMYNVLHVHVLQAL